MAKTMPINPTTGKPFKIGDMIETEAQIKALYELPTEDFMGFIHNESVLQCSNRSSVWATDIKYRKKLPYKIVDLPLAYQEFYAGRRPRVWEKLSLEEARAALPEVISCKRIVLCVHESRSTRYTDEMWGISAVTDIVVALRFGRVEEVLV